jgi:hypothetical protein
MSIPYSSFLQAVQPLDLIFFRGTSLFSDAIIDAEKIALKDGDWSHVAVVVNKTVLPDLNRVYEGKINNNDDLYLWESTLSTNCSLLNPQHILDAESGQPVLGVQIRSLKEVIQSDLKSDTIVGWASLKNHLITTSALQQDLISVHDKYYHQMYQANIFRMCGSLYPRLKCLRGKLCIGNDWIFCSQLVGLIYQAVGIYSKTINCSLINPQDLITPSLSSQPLPVVLNKIIYVTV